MLPLFSVTLFALVEDGMPSRAPNGVVDVVGLDAQSLVAMSNAIIYY